MADGLDLNRSYPVTWDQSERLSSAARRKKERDKQSKAWRIRDVSRVEDIRRGWFAIVAKHPSLRVDFEQYQPDYWTQRVLPREAVESWFTVLDDPSDEELARLRSQVGFHTGQRFSVAVARRKDCLEIYFTVDHICLDSRSIGVILREWSDHINGVEVSAETDDLFLQHCLDNPADPESRRRREDELTRTPATTFVPYAEPPLIFSGHPGGYTLEASSLRIPWDAFSFDARPVAAGIGPVLLTGGLRALHGDAESDPVDYPLVGVITGRPTLRHEHAVGPYSTWCMLPIPVSGDELIVKARKVYGRLLTALRRPPVPFPLENLVRSPEWVAARNWRFDRSPRYLYANHLNPTPDFVIGPEVAEVVTIPGKLRGWGVARVLSRSWDDSLNLEFTARSDLLAAGVTDRLARYAVEQAKALKPQAMGATG
jgi:hypothetical protein